MKRVSRCESRFGSVSSTREPLPFWLVGKSLSFWSHAHSMTREMGGMSLRSMLPMSFHSRRPRKRRFKSKWQSGASFQPGEKFETDTMEVALPTAKTKHYSKREALGPGVHWMQVVVLASDEGTGAYITATSQPMKVEVEQPPNSNRCE